MKKTIITMAILAVTALGFTAYAQENATPDCKVKKECKMRDARPGQCTANPFEGIELTADQQAKIDAIKAECKAERKAAKEAKAEAAKTKRQECRTEYINKMKEVLTPEQYTKFLENMATQAPAAGHKMMRGGKTVKCDKAVRGGMQECDKVAKDCKAVKDQCTKEAKDCKHKCDKVAKDCKKVVEAAK